MYTVIFENAKTYPVYEVGKANAIVIFNDH